MDITLPADSVTDLDGGDLTNPGSNTMTIQCTSNFSEQWVIDDAASWTAATSANSNLDISGGFAEPLANNSQFTSIVKT